MRGCRSASADRSAARLDGAVEVGAPAPRVLRHEHDLAHAARHVRVHFRAHVGEGETAVAPADEGDGAVGAEAVAAVGYLHVGGNRPPCARRIGFGGEAPVRLHARAAFRGPVARRCRRVSVACTRTPAADCAGRARRAFRQLGEHAFQHLHDVVLAGTRHEGARLGKLVFQRLAVARRHAARHHQGGAAVLHAGKPRHVEDGLDALLGGRLDERAGVHHHRVGERGVVHHRMPRRLHAFAHVRRVHLVLGASQGDERHRARAGRALPPLRALGHAVGGIHEAHKAGIPSQR